MPRFRRTRLERGETRRQGRAGKRRGRSIADAKVAGSRFRTAKVAVACIVVLAVLAVVPVFVNTAIGYIPVICACTLLILCFAYLMVLKRSLSFAEEGPDNGCTRGDVLNFALTVNNRSILPVTRMDVHFYISDVYGGAGTTTVRRLTLPPRSQKTFDLGVRFDHIGNYEIGIKRVGVYDPLGLFHSVRENAEMHAVDIVPRLFEVNSLALSDDAQRESVKNVKTYMSDGMDYSGVREYRWGDPIKAIHWKLSSKAIDTYFTRLYEMPTTPGVAVFCDLEASGYDASELMEINDAVVEAAFSIINYANANGYDAELLFVDSIGEARRFSGPLDSYRAKALEAMPLMHEGKGDAVRELLRKESASIYCQHNIAVCTANADAAMANSLIGAASARHNPLLFAVDVKGEASSGGAMAAVAAGSEEGDGQTFGALGSKNTLRRLSAAGIWCRRLKSAAELERSA